MKKIKYGIVSYHRPKCMTYRALINLGVPNEDILISLNDINDYQNYKATYPKARIIVKAGNNVATNRNNILNQFEEDDYIVLLDDDVRNFQIWQEKKANNFGTIKMIKNYETFNLINSEVFSIMREKGCLLGGCVATNNSMNIAPLIRKGVYYTFNTLIQGGWNFIINNKELRYEETLDMVEDYELCLRLIKKGEKIIRFNGIVPDKAYMGQLEGGMYDRYQNNEQKKWLKLVAMNYSKYVSMSSTKLLMKKGVAFDGR